MQLSGCLRRPLLLGFAGLGFLPTFRAEEKPPGVIRPLAPFLLALPASSPAVTERVERALKAPLTTIIDKPQPSPTGDAHDYISYGRYWWPDPAKPDGRPFIRHDGHANEAQVEQGDQPRLIRFCTTVESLAIGWAAQQRADCAQRAGDWLRAWFITPATRLNPNLDHAQIRLGHDHDFGSSSGVLDARSLAEVIDALRLLHGSPALTPAEETGVQAWFTDYARWLATSKNGRGEQAATNNHGSWYLVQAVAISRGLGRDEDARRLCKEDRPRIGWQIKPDGTQPLELARADGLGYSVFNLEAQFQLARLAAGLGVDLWHYEAPEGGSLKKAFAYLLPYNDGAQKWPGTQYRQIDSNFLQSLLPDARREWPELFQTAVPRS